MKRYAQKTTRARRLIPWLAVFLALGACREPIFYIIQQEVKLKDPVIPGGPGRIVEFDGKLYVPAGKIYVYDDDKDGAKRWQKLGNVPAGKALALAATESFLYALMGDGESIGSNRLYRRAKVDSSQWGQVPGGTYSLLQSIFDATDRIFVGAYNTSVDSDIKNMSYGIMTILDGSLDLEPAASFDAGADARLTGAALSGGTYYLATSKGIYQWTDGAPIAASTAPVAAGNVIGLTAWDSGGTTHLLGIIRGSSSGDLLWYYDGAAREPKQTGYFFTAAAGVWRSPSDPIASKPKLLLLGHGRKPETTTTYTYGYYEVVLQDGALNIDDFTVQDPGSGEPVAKNESYATSLGKHAINSLYQVPKEIDSDMPVFASTQKDGLWSLRDREWNIEE